jgi:hypothetical protein
MGNASFVVGYSLLAQGLRIVALAARSIKVWAIVHCLLTLQTFARRLAKTILVATLRNGFGGLVFCKVSHSKADSSTLG